MVIECIRGGGNAGSREQLLTELNSLPEKIAHEVLDFVQFLKRKAAKENIDISIMSESSLGKDWLSSTEEEAWKDL